MFRGSAFRCFAQLRRKQNQGDTAGVARGFPGPPWSVFFPPARSTPAENYPWRLCRNSASCRFIGRSGLFPRQWPWRLRSSVDSRKLVRERRFLPVCTGKSGGGHRNCNAAEMPPPPGFPPDVCFSHSTGSTPGKQKRTRLSRNSIVGQLVCRAWSSFCLNEKTPPGTHRRRPPNTGSAFGSPAVFPLRSRLPRKNNEDDTANAARGRTCSP